MRDANLGWMCQRVPGREREGHGGCWQHWNGGQGISCRLPGPRHPARALTGAASPGPSAHTGTASPGRGVLPVSLQTPGRTRVRFSSPGAAGSSGCSRALLRRAGAARWPRLARPPLPQRDCSSLFQCLLSQGCSQVLLSNPHPRFVFLIAFQSICWSVSHSTENTSERAGAPASQALVLLRPVAASSVFTVVHSGKQLFIAFMFI